MKNNMKRRKHALRKAVTAAVLAGTAFSSFGGALGTVTSVKAEEYTSVIPDNDRDGLINLAIEAKLRDLSRKEKSDVLKKNKRIFKKSKNRDIESFIIRFG